MPNKLTKKFFLKLIEENLTSKERHLLNALYILQDCAGGVCISMADLMLFSGVSHKTTFLGAKRGLEKRGIISVENRRNTKTGNQEANYYQFTVVQNRTPAVVRTMNHGQRCKNEPLIYVYK